MIEPIESCIGIPNHRLEFSRPNLRILHFCTEFSPLSQTFVYDYITELERQGADNHLATFDHQNAVSRPFAKVRRLKIPGRWHPNRVFFRTLAALKRTDVIESSWSLLRERLRQTLVQVAPDVVHAHFGWEGALVAPVAEREGVPLVVTFYGYDISMLTRIAAWRGRYERLWPRMAAATALSEQMQCRMMQLGCPAYKIQVVHLGRNIDKARPREPRFPLRRFVSVGRLVEKKGFLDAVRAIRLLAGEYPDVQLEIIGEGPLHGELGDCIRQNQVQDRVKVLGALPSERTLEVIANADVFLLCSRTAANGDAEGTPTVLIEAQAIGLPCVSTTHAGIPEMIPPDNRRFLAPEGNVDEIVGRMRSLLECPEPVVLEIAGRGRDFVKENFNLTREASKFISLYDRICTVPRNGHARKVHQ